MIGAPLSSLAWMSQPSDGGSPATAMSPPRLTSAPPPPIFARAAAAARSEVIALAVAPRSRSTPCGMRIVRAASSNAIACHPGTLLTTRSIAILLDRDLREVGVSRPA